MMNTFLHLLLTAVNCGTLTDPANGQVSHTAGTTYQQIATYNCDPGYTLVGDSTRTCQAIGMWSGSEPTCQGALLLSTPQCTKNLDYDFTLANGFIPKREKTSLLTSYFCHE